MMMDRRNQILSVILAAQIVIAIAVFWPRTAVSGETGGPLLPNLQASDVVSLVIDDGAGMVTEMARKGDGWVLSRADDYPADGTKVTPFLEKLEKLTTDRLVTQTDASHKRLRVADDDFARKIDVELGGGKSHELYLGTSGGYGSTHVRADGQSDVYLTADLATWDANAQPSAWIDTLYFTVPQTITVAITLENEQGTFEFETDGDTWAMKGLADEETLNQNSVIGLLNQISSVRMQAPIGKTEQDSFGLDQPQAMVTVKVRDGGEEQTHTLRIGAKHAPGEESSSEAPYYVVSSSQSLYFVRLPEYLGDSLSAMARADFLEVVSIPTTVGTE